MSNRIERFNKATKEHDDEYLQEFEAGRQLAFNGLSLDEAKDVPQGVQDGFDSASETMDALPESATRNKVYAQPHPLGGIEIIVFGVDGTKTSARIKIEDTAVLIATLNMWVTSLLQQTYMQMAQTANSVSDTGIVIPGR